MARDGTCSWRFISFCSNWLLSRRSRCCFRAIRARPALATLFHGREFTSAGIFARRIREYCKAVRMEPRRGGHHAVIYYAVPNFRQFQRDRSGRPRSSGGLRADWEIPRSTLLFTSRWFWRCGQSVFSRTRTSNEAPRAKTVRRICTQPSSPCVFCAGALEVAMAGLTRRQHRSKPTKARADSATSGRHVRNSAWATTAC